MQRPCLPASSLRRHCQAGQQLPLWFCCSELQRGAEPNSTAGFVQHLSVHGTQLCRRSGALCAATLRRQVQRFSTLLVRRQSRNLSPPSPSDPAPAELVAATDTLALVAGHIPCSATTAHCRADDPKRTPRGLQSQPQGNERARGLSPRPRMREPCVTCEGLNRHDNVRKRSKERGRICPLRPRMREPSVSRNACGGYM